MTIVDGHPVPYSLTVFPEAGEAEPNETEIRALGDEYLRTHGKPDARVVRTDGRYAFYEYRR